MNHRFVAPRHAAGVGIVALVASLAGCRSYQPRPLDLAESQRDLVARSPSSPQVAAFAAELRKVGVAPAFDPSDGVSLAEAETIALVYNADLRLARLRAGVARAAADHAGLWEDPTLGVDLTKILASVENAWKVGVPLDLTIPLSGRLGAEQSTADARYAAELAQVRVQEWETRLALREMWAEWTASRRRERVLSEFLERLEEIVQIVGRMEAAGEMPRVEARLFRIERADRRAELREAQAHATERELAIKRLCGLPMSIDAAFGLGSPDESREAIEALRERLAQTSPAMIVARMDHEIAERRMAEEITGQYPDLGFGPGYGREDGHNEARLGLSIKLPLWNRNRRGVAVAEAEREVTRASFGVAYERTLADLEAAWVRASAASDRRRTMEAEVVPLIDEQYAEARRIAELGEVSTLVLLESLSRQQVAKVGLLDAWRAQRLAEIEIDRIVGPREGFTENAR